MKKKIVSTQIARGLITALALLLISYLANAQPQIATPDGFAGYAGTTGGGNATPVTVSSASAFKSAVSGNSPAVIFVNGFLNVGSVSIGSNKTIVGMTESSGIGGGTISVNGSNYIFQNLIVGPGGSDVMEVSGGKKVFITKCSFHDCGDELLSIVRGADFVTVSWCKFYFERTHDHALAHLIGNSDGASGDNGKLNTTMHHNWYAEGVRARMPRVRYGKVHIYNNFFNSEGNGYGIGVGVHCHIRLENSHFKNMNRIWNNMGGAKNGEMGWDNLILEGCSQPTFISNSFPVFNPPYAYSMDPVDNVESLVKAGAGNVMGTTVRHSLSTSVNGQGSVSPSGGEFTEGSTVTITATGNTGWRFDHWSGDADGTTNPVTITMNSDKSVIAHFVEVPTHTLTSTVIGQGSISPGSGTFSEGEVVFITATPDMFWQFEGWSGDASGTANPLSLTMDANKNITATFIEVPVAGVSVSPAATNIGIDGSVQLSAVVEPSNAANQNVSWSSSNTEVATVSPSGLVTGISYGTATITATTEEGGFTATCEVTVTDIVINKITIQENETGVLSFDGSIDNNHSGFTGDGFINTSNSSGSGITWEVCIPSNGTYSLQWRYANGGSADRTAQIVVNGATAVSNVGFPSTGAWNSWANSSSMDIELSSGTKQIRLEATNSSGLANIDYITIEGNNPKGGDCYGEILVTGVSVSPTTASVDEGETIQLTPTVDPSNATNKTVSWSSSNEAIATVSSSGIVSGIGKGTAVITVTTQDGGFTATSEVIVNAVVIPVSGVSVSPTTTTLNIGTTKQLTASVEPSNATNKSVSWSSSDEAIATVSSSGLVTGVAEGSAIVTVTTQDGGFTATSEITVTEQTSITLTLQENEDGFCSVDGSIDNNHSGHTGSGFANTDNANGNGITWSVNIPSPGTYSIEWRYANGGGSDRTAQLMEDGSPIETEISMPSTGAWNSWATTPVVNANLSAGNKLIRLQATNSSGLANIDYIKITGNGISAVACSGLKNSTIANFTEGIDVQIFPVPAKELVNIQFSKEIPETVEIELLDAMGRLVFSKSSNGQNNTIDLSGLQNGFYMVRISGSNTKIMKTIVKE